MNLYKASGEWSDELVSDAAKLGVPPNMHPLILALPIKPAPPPPPATAPAPADASADAQTQAPQAGT